MILRGTVPSDDGPEKFYTRIRELDADGSVIPETVVVKYLPATPASEFPSPVLPAAAVTGLLGIVLLIRKNRQ